MAGIKPLRKIQMGLETTAGTAVAADTLWRGTGSVKDSRETVYPEEDVGYVAGLNRHYVPKYLAEITFNESEATFEQLPIILSASIENTVTGAADGAGSDKIYAFDFPTTAANAITKPWTIEWGDNQQAEEAAYCVCTGWTLSGNPGEAMMVSADWIGRQAATSTYTADISPATVHEILFSNGTFYLDDAGGTPGGSAKTDTLMGLSITASGFSPLFTGDGAALYYSTALQTGFEMTAEVKMIHNATAVAEIAAWRAGTGRILRYKNEGVAVGTAGTTYSKYTLIIDLYGSWSEFSGLDDVDDNDIVTGTFKVLYDSTSSAIGSITVVNETAAL